MKADRLAKEKPGHQFVVLGPIAAYSKSDVQVTELAEYFERGEGDVPF